MTPDPETRKQLAAWDEALDPSHPVDPSEGDTRYVPIDGFVDEQGQEHHLRGNGDVVPRPGGVDPRRFEQARRLEHPAAGGISRHRKDHRTETHPCQPRPRALEVVSFDASEFLPLTDAPTAAQLGLVLAGGIAELIAHGRQLESLQGPGYWERVRHFLARSRANWS